MATKLSVNLNAVALLRNRRDLPWPSVTGLGRIALEAGAHGLTVHPRPDERHTRRADLAPLRALVDEFQNAEFNIEGYPDEAFLRLVEEHRPDQVTLVPDDPAQPTSDHGWSFDADYTFLQPIVARLKQNGFRVSLFANPEPAGLDKARALGADRVEFFTGPYGACDVGSSEAQAQLESLRVAANEARANGLEINAGHDLTVANLLPLVREIPFIAEVSIGHGLTADALEFGMAKTVERFLNSCKG